LFIAGGSNDSPDMVEGMTKLILNTNNPAYLRNYLFMQIPATDLECAQPIKGPERFTEWLSPIGLMKN
jgi:hypothetical protein